MGALRPREGQRRCEVTQHCCIFLCRPLPGPDSFINLVNPTAPDGGSVPSALSRPRRGSLIKKNSSVRKSLLLLSLPPGPGHAFWRERKEGRWTGAMEKPPSEEANVDLGWREPRNVLSALWPGEGAVVQGRASGGPRGAASPGSQPVPALPPTSCKTWASFLTT